MSSLREEILERIDIVDLVEKYVDLKKVGNNWTGLCPFHKEKTPSFTVSDQKQIFKCFGCGKGGNAITFHMEIERLEFWDSMQELAKMTNTDISKYSHNPEKSQEKRNTKEKYKLLNKRLQSVFKDSLEGSSAQQYLTQQRKLTQKTIKAFGLGYAPDNHYTYIKYLKQKGFENGDLIQGGVAKQGSSGDTYAFFRNRLTFPVHNHIGTIVGFGARALEEGQNPKYLNTTETPLYDKSRILYGLDKAKQHINEFKSLIIVEGYMDVIALYQYGLPIGVATCGTALTPEHMKLIQRHSETVIFAFDNDSAGFQATLRGMKTARQQGIFPKVLLLPEGYKDIDEYLTKSGETISMDDLLHLCKDGYDAIIERLKETYDLKNPVLRKKFTAMVFDCIRHIEDYGIFMIYFEKTAHHLSTSESILIKDFKKHIAQKRIPYQNNPAEKAEKNDLLVTAGALFYNNFLNDQKIDYDQIKDTYDKLTSFTSIVEEHPLKKIIDENVSPEQKQQLLEQQLTREEQWKNENSSKITLDIKQFLTKALHTLKRSAIKDPKLTKQQKSALMQL